MNESLRKFRARRLINRMKAPCTDCSDAVVAAPVDVQIHGLAVPYDTPTGDGRMVAKGALTWDLADSGVPIIWDRAEGDHTGMTLGKVDAFRADDSGVYVDGARLFATEDQEASAAVARVTELIGEGALGWSVMMDDESIEIVHRDPKVTEGKDGQVTILFNTADDMQKITSARIRHLAIVDTPAFPGARPQLGPAPVNAAAAAVATYPHSHFARWESRDLVPLQTDSDGRVWGHAAGDGCYRGGRADQCLKYSADPDPAMRNFHTGTVGLDNGNVIRVGSLTAAGLHASASGSLDAQRRHHEDSTTVWAKVVAWNDDRGRLCVAGSVVPGLDSTFAAQVAGLPLSVELWPVPGVSGLTLVGAHSVVSPAWPVAASVSAD